MNIKRLFSILFTVAAFSLLLMLTVSAESWWENCSDTVAVYPTSPPTTVGDLDRNGLVDAADARQTMRFAVGLDKERLPHVTDADLDGDKKITAADARKVLRCAVGLEETLTPQADNGFYRLRVSSNYYDFNTLDKLNTLFVNSDKVKNAWRDGGSLPLWRLRSVGDVQEFINAFRTMKFLPADAIEVPAFLQRYDSSFFKTRELFISYVVEGSGSNLQAVYSPTIEKDGTTAAVYPLPDMSNYAHLVKDGTLTFSVGSVSPAFVTCDIGCWFLFLPVEKTATEGCAAFDCQFGNSGILPYAEYRAARKGETKWMFAKGQALFGDAEIELRKGNETTFALENAQDGGYFWEYTTDADVGTYKDVPTSDADHTLLIREDDVTKPSAGDGAPGMQIYTICPTRPGTYTLRFSLKRSWETAPIAERTVTLIVGNENRSSITVFPQKETGAMAQTPVPAALDAEVRSALKAQYTSENPDGLLHAQSYRLLAEQTVYGLTTEKTVYLLVYASDYRMGGAPEEIQGRFVPTAITFVANDNGTFELKDYQAENDGTNDRTEVLAGFPASAAKEALATETYAAELKNSNLEQVNAYLSALQATD